MQVLGEPVDDFLLAAVDERQVPFVRELAQRGEGIAVAS
jgi:hypothetical protein